MKTLLRAMSLLIAIASAAFCQTAADRDWNEIVQRMQNEQTDARLQELENERAREARQRQAEITAHDNWVRRADVVLNASWQRLKPDLTRQYPDLKDPRSTMFLLFQHICQDMRDRENPIILDANAAKLIADRAGRQLGITRLPLSN